MERLLGWTWQGHHHPSNLTPMLRYKYISSVTGTPAPPLGYGVYRAARPVVGRGRCTAHRGHHPPGATTHPGSPPTGLPPIRGHHPPGARMTYIIRMMVVNAAPLPPSTGATTSLYWESECQDSDGWMRSTPPSGSTRWTDPS